MYYRSTPSCLAAILLATVLASCGKDDDAGTSNVMMTLTMKAGTGAAMTADPAVTDLRLCFKRLRFKTAEEDESTDDAKDDADSDNVDIAIGEVAVTDKASVLGQVSVPEGKYRRIEVDLDKKCAGYSVKVTNAQGTFQTDDRVKIKFRGDFDASSAQPSVTLVIDEIVAALAAVTDGATIRSAISNPSGIVKNE